MTEAAGTAAPHDARVPGLSACACGGIFATLVAVDALIVFLQLCGLFQAGWLDPQLARKRVL
jgi:hypothetical protein